MVVSEADQAARDKIRKRAQVLEVIEVLEDSPEVHAAASLAFQHFAKAPGIDWADDNQELKLAIEGNILNACQEHHYQLRIQLGESGVSQKNWDGLRQALGATS